MTLGFPEEHRDGSRADVRAQRGAPADRAAGAAAAAVAAAARFFEGVGSVAATAEAASIRIHHSIVELPDADYKPRRFDPRAGLRQHGLRELRGAARPADDPAVHPPSSSAEERSVGRGERPVKPIIYYLDPGAPEPIRSALLDGARWWNQAFEAAGYRDAFRVELLPEGVSPLDIRYNVINWVHRSTRGWSTGGSVTDPRTGEIIKGVVTLGSLRIRQDYMIAEGLLSPYKDGTESPNELTEWALARIRQLSAHEVGHTLGIGHNYYDSKAGRISVMDYPHPLVTLKADGTLDYSKVYDVGIGEWDKVAITYGYSDFPTGTDEAKALATILEEGHKKDLWYLSNQDMGAHPRVDQWSNGTDATAELKRMMAIRKVALSRFGEQAIKRNEPMATIEEVLVPLYLHHRYQVEAAASSVGGIYFTYALRGDGREPVSFAPAAEQTAALDALLATLKPSELALPRELLDEDPAAAVRIRPHARALPALHGPDVRRDHSCRVAADLTVGFSARRCARGAARRAARARPGAARTRNRDRPAAVVDLRRHAAERLRGGDRARRSARRRRTPDDAGLDRRHVAGPGDRERRSCSSARSG